MEATCEGGRHADDQRGYAAAAGTELVRADLTREAIRLARVLRELMPDEPEATGLLALMLLTEARRPARTDGGRLVPLAEQDRSRWDRAVVTEGLELVRACLRRDRPGPYQIQAAITAVHTHAPSVATTDWGQIVALYDLLTAHDPGPVARLHRAVAVAEVDGPATALALVNAIELDGYYLLHAVRGDLLRRLGRKHEAAAAYTEAMNRTGNAAERDHLERLRGGLED